VRYAAAVISPIYDSGATEDEVARRYVEYYDTVRRERGRGSAVARP
jgi:hypothetical protein